MRKIIVRHIPSIAGAAINLDLAAILGQFFNNIFGFFQRLFRPRNLV